MLYRKMPKNGDELSILGFGCMRLPVKDGSIDEERAMAQVRFAIDQGVNYIDTAWTYHAGESENFLGRALRDGYRERVKLATKLPSYLVKTREDMDMFLDTQLGKLQTDHLDYYLLHNLTGPLWDSIDVLGVRSFLDSAKTDGRIVNAGFSFHGLPSDFNRIVDAYDWDFCLIQYNYLDEENQAGTRGLEYAASKGMGVFVMEPLRGGNLGIPEAPPAIQEIWNEASLSRTPAEWALRWVWNRPEVKVVLSGMNEEAHIKENLGIAEEARPGSLSAGELALVKRAAGKYREIMKVNCTGCGYCTPCPAGVNIPAAFEVYNKMHLFGNFQEGKMNYVIKLSGIVRKGVTSYASQCVECGQCLEKCPQSLDIPTLLKDVVAELEGPDMEELAARARKSLNLESA
ncbi:MAG TPA: aldo/keto reductase [Thermovirgaceae bacterium]|nr:aldo/keto reductase [Thermovirgaceae bacterium]